MRLLKLLPLLFAPIAVLAANPVTIDMVYNLTGSQSVLDANSLKGAELAVKELNAKGGLLGQKVKFNVINGESNRKIIESKTFAAAQKPNTIFMGLSDNNMLTAALSAMALNHKLFVTSGATSGFLANIFSHDLFLTTYTDKQQGQVAATFALQHLKAKTAILVVDKRLRYAQDVSEAFGKTYQAKGGTIDLAYAFDHGGMKWVIHAMKQYKFNPKMIYLAVGPKEAATDIEALRQSGFKGPILGGDSFSGPYLKARLGKNANNVFYTTHGFLSLAKNNVFMYRFMMSYQKEYGAYPTSVFTALGYDAVNVIASGIKKAKTMKTPALRKALRNVSVQGVLGPMVYNNTNTPKKGVTVVGIIHGNMQQLSTSF
jgi:branched-chain amino acid transport system substrate-binding protein